MTQPMKFWEAISTFRNDKDLLNQVFSDGKWRSAYFEMFSKFDEYVQQQDRAILDAPLPTELTRDIAAQYTKAKFLLCPEQRLLRLVNEDDPVKQGCIELTAIEVFDRFGGSVIEEVMEFGSVVIVV